MLCQSNYSVFIAVKAILANPPTSIFFGREAPEISAAPVTQMLASGGPEDHSAAFVQTYSENRIFTPSRSMNSSQRIPSYTPEARVAAAGMKHTLFDGSCSSPVPSNSIPKMGTYYATGEGVDHIIYNCHSSL